MAGIYTLNGQQVYDTNGQTFYASGANAGQAYTGTQPTVNTPTPVPTQSAQPMQTNAQYWQSLQKPAATQPPTPAPQMDTPSAPQITINNTAAPTQQPQTKQPSQSLTAPASGSIIDLLNQAGVDSSYTNRKQLAQQYGIQGYTGSAVQNKALMDKYIAAYNAKKAEETPASMADARSMTQQYFKEDKGAAPEDAQQTFFDEYMSMNPIIKSMYDQINHELSTPRTAISFREEFENLQKEQGLPALNAEFLDVKRIMDGTEDDIREEITKAGGMATESQVQALTGARNKTLLKQANNLAMQIQMKNDYVDQMMLFTRLDRDEVEKQIDRKLGLTEKLATLQGSMYNAARENYQNIVTQVGYDGLAAATLGNSRAQNEAERMLGLPRGSLSNASFLSSMTKAKSPTASIQEYEYARDQGYKGSFEKWQIEDANRKKASSGLTDYQQIQTFNGIVGKYNASPLIEAKDRLPVLISSIEEIRKNPSNGPLQLNLSYSYIQALDTYQSAVREGELSLVNSIDSKTGQIRNYYDQIQNGQIVRPEVALEMANAAEKIVQTIQDAAKTKTKAFQAQADVAGVGEQFKSYRSGFEGTAPSPNENSTQIEYNGKTYNVDSNGEMTEVEDLQDIPWDLLQVSIPSSSRLSYINNNPGNLKFVGQPGAKLGAKGFAEFPTPQAGLQALARQIKLDASRGLTIAQFVNKYAPPSENDTDIYIRQIANITGTNPNTPIKNIPILALTKAIANKESSTKIV